MAYYLALITMPIWAAGIAVVAHELFVAIGKGLGGNDE